MQGRLQAGTRPFGVFIVEASPSFRKLLQQLYRSIPEVSVVGTAAGGPNVVREIMSCKPDLVSLDMSTLGNAAMAVLQGLKKQKPSIKVLLVTDQAQGSQADTVKALRLGALDLVGRNEKDLKEKIPSLLGPIMARRKPVEAEACTLPSIEPMKFKEKHLSVVPAIIAIGVSTGGPQALSCFFGNLPSFERTPILIVQHMPPTFTRSLATSLARDTHYKVLEAENGIPIEEGHAYIAPGGFHMLVECFRNRPVIQINDDPPLDSFRPSVNKFFSSVARVYQEAVVGIILTGMGEDGARGLLEIKQAGGFTIAQDEATSAVFGMPKKAIELGAVEKVSPLENIPQVVCQLTQSRKIGIQGHGYS